MTRETKKAMDDSYDVIVELIEFIRNRVGTNLPESRELINKAKGVLDSVNDELYKTL